MCNHISMSIETYIKSTAPRSRKRQAGKLSDTDKADIQRLNDLGYSLQQIVEYLQTKGVEVSRTAVHNYVQKGQAK